MVDLDQFKMINDSLGHEAGDELLLGIAPRLRDAVGEHATIARLGGDEFVVVIEHLESEADALDAAKRLAEAWARPFALGVDEVFVSGCVGVAVSGARDANASTMLREADAAMYRAKEQGRGRFELFDEVMRARALERLRMESDLRRALDQDELDLAYQPIFDVDTGRPVAVEALLRWSHPVRGPVSPAEFIPVAEDSGLIVPIGRWVLQRACAQVAAWRRRLPADAPLRLCVNLSARHVARPEVVSDVALALRTSGLPAESLALEITESVLMEEGEVAQAALGDLRALGVSLYLDDFGTGYSSLGYLRRFPLDALKIDRSFVEGITESSRGVRAGRRDHRHGARAGAPGRRRRRRDGGPARAPQAARLPARAGLPPRLAAARGGRRRAARGAIAPVARRPRQASALTKRRFRGRLLTHLPLPFGADGNASPHGAARHERRAAGRPLP